MVPSLIDALVITFHSTRSCSLSPLFGGATALGHRFAAAWVRVRAFGDGQSCCPRDDPDGLSVVYAARSSIYLR